MAVTYAAPTTQQNSTNSGTRTISVTVGAGANGLVVIFAAETNTTVVTTGITFDTTQNLVKKDSQAGASFGNLEIWELKDPHITTANVVITKTVDFHDVIGIYVLTGVDTSGASFLRTAAKATAATGTSASVTVSGVVTGDLALAGLNLDGTSHAVVGGTNETVDFDLPSTAGANELAGITQLGANGGAFTPTWTTSGPNSIIATAAIAAAAPGGSVTPFRVFPFALRKFLRPGVPALGFPIPSAAPALGAFQIAADPGAYTLTGVSADLVAGRIIVATPGAYTLTGVDALPVAGRVVPAVPGSYALTGTDALPVADRVVIATPGTYTLTGVATDLLAARLVNADPGSYVLTGTAADLVYTAGAAAFTLNADTGVYTLTGVAAAPVADRVITTAPGAYTLTGAAADTVAGRMLPAAVGSYTLTGVQTAQLTTRVINADPGAYTLTGADTTLDWSGFTPPPTQGNDDIAAVYSTFN